MVFDIFVNSTGALRWKRPSYSREAQSPLAWAKQTPYRQKNPPTDWSGGTKIATPYDRSTIYFFTFSNASNRIIETRWREILSICPISTARNLL